MGVVVYQAGCDLILLCATAIEDDFQDDVPKKGNGQIESPSLHKNSSTKTKTKTDKLSLHASKNIPPPKLKNMPRENGTVKLSTHVCNSRSTVSWDQRRGWR